VGWVGLGLGVGWEIPLRVLRSLSKPTSNARIPGTIAANLTLCAVTWFNLSNLKIGITEVSPGLETNGNGQTFKNSHPQFLSLKVKTEPSR